MTPYRDRRIAGHYTAIPERPKPVAPNPAPAPPKTPQKKEKQ